MTDPTFRTTDNTKWGVGKGANLTATEIDLNWWSILTRVRVLETTPTAPLQIQSIEVVGNQMTITLSDGVTIFGPFNLPTAVFNFRGDWHVSTSYALYDVFVADEGLYLVVKEHESNDTVFNPLDGDITGVFARLIFPYPNVYDLAFFFPGTPGTGLAADETMFGLKANKDFYLPADLPGTMAGVFLDATAPIVLRLFKNSDAIGTVTIDPADSENTIEVDFPDMVQFNLGDWFRVLRPATLDATAKGLSANFAAKKGIFV